MDELRSGGASEGHGFNIENPLWGKRYLSRRQLMHGAGGLAGAGSGRPNRPRPWPRFVHSPVGYPREPSYDPEAGGRRIGRRCP